MKYNIIQLNDDGNILLPQTSIDAIVDSNGVSFRDVLRQMLNKDASLALSEIGGWKASSDGETFVDVSLPDSINAIDGQSQSYARRNEYYMASIDIDDVSVKRYFLYFVQVSQKCDISVGGVHVATHKGGYTPFFVDISEYVQVGENEIAVISNNEEDTQLAPVSSDFNKNNCLQKVYLVATPLVHAKINGYGYDRMHVTQSDVSAESASVQLLSSIINDSSSGKSVKVCYTISGNNGGTIASFSETVNVEAGAEEEITHTFTVENPHLWDGKNDPYLHNASIVLECDGNVIDIISTKFGIRYFAITSNGFVLNGKSYPLRGVSYHQDKYLKANAISDDDIDNDFTFIEEIGCNFLRVAHYPHNRRVFDLCDELGIVVQTEIPWVNECGVNATEEYLSNLKSQMAELLTEHHNHASIIFVGMSNEVGNGSVQGSTDKAKFIAYNDELYAYSKTLDSERLIGFVSGYQKAATQYFGGTVDTDWLGVNVYEGWYENTTNPAYVSTRMASEKSAFSAVALSEYGAGCNPNCHSENPSSTTNKGSGGARHDEEWANFVHETHLQKIYSDMTYLLFSSCWILFDFAVSARLEGYKETSDGVTITENDEKKYTNDKGLVTRDRTVKKDVFYLYKAKWNAMPMVYITSRRFTTRPSGNVAVKVYSNCDSLKLYQDDVLKQTLTASGEASGVIWSFNSLVIGSTDTFKVVGYDADGNEVAVDEVEFTTGA